MAEKKTTDEFKEAFVDMLHQLPKISGVSRLLGIHSSNVYVAMEADPIFRKRVQDAIEESHDDLEVEARRRGKDGVLKPVFYKGEVVGEVREYSDDLLKFLLRGYRSKTFGSSSKMEIEGQKVTMIFDIGGDE